MDNGLERGERPLAISDTERLRRIGQDLRSLDAEVIRQPLPERIQATFALIDREQRLLNLCLVRRHTEARRCSQDQLARGFT
ncbi:hypothetical protein [Microvirga sesbaniae]|uniref:hypothetical protein n=1 Tax=Microvirga sesbaniae TaxID=681392 RepID=UPI0021C75B86|nr:hypothetical protein [Microvirga sp. HBU67692]